MLVSRRANPWATMFAELTQALGAPTYLVSPVDFAQNPMTLFVTLSRYKIKDTYATSQMLDYAMSAMAGKGFQMQELKNLMISAEGRPRVDICTSPTYIARQT